MNWWSSNNDPVGQSGKVKSVQFGIGVYVFGYADNNGNGLVDLPSHSAFLLGCATRRGSMEEQVNGLKQGHHA